MSFGFYADQNLTNLLNTTSNPLTITMNVSGGGATLDLIVYFGSPDDTKKALPATDVEITVDIVDTDTANAHNLDATNGPWYVLGLSAAELDTNPKNSSINIGTQVLGGVANAVPIHIRLFEPEQNPALWEDLQLKTNVIRVENV
ncbi:hypothetical protein [Persephonella sp.]